MEAEKVFPRYVKIVAIVMSITIAQPTAKHATSVEKQITTGMCVGQCLHKHPKLTVSGADLPQKRGAGTGHYVKPFPGSQGDFS